MLHEEAPAGGGIPAAFASAAANPDSFDHVAHVRLALDLLAEYGVMEALHLYSRGLEELTRTLGVSGKYHATVTGFFILQIAERRAAGRAQDFDEFRADNPDLFGNVRRLLLNHYSAARLDSDLARRQFLLPDRSGCKAPG